MLTWVILNDALIMRLASYGLKVSRDKISLSLMDTMSKRVMEKVVNGHIIVFSERANLHLPETLIHAAEYEGSCPTASQVS